MGLNKNKSLLVAGLLLGMYALTGGEFFASAAMTIAWLPFVSEELESKKERKSETK